jgi:hypothetical protein
MPASSAGDAASLARRCASGGSAIQSGDADLAQGNEAIIAEALLEIGFYYVGADFEMGVEFVAKPLLDGRTDWSRLELVSVGDEDRKVRKFPPIEGMIADRLTQYEEHPRDHIDMLLQAKILWHLAVGLDLAYLLGLSKKSSARPSGDGLLDEPEVVSRVMV